MKKQIALILALVLCMSLTSAAFADEVQPLRVADEGYVIEGDGWYSVNAWCKSGDADLFGRIYYPADFDETQQYTAVLLVHGMTLNADFWHKIYAPELAKAGYICYAFDERSGTTGGRGSYSTPLPEGENPDATIIRNGAYGTTILEPDEPTREGFVFCGWMPVKENGEPGDVEMLPEFMPDTNPTILLS